MGRNKPGEDNSSTQPRVFVGNYDMLVDERLSPGAKVVGFFVDTLPPTTDVLTTVQQLSMDSGETRKALHQLVELGYIDSAANREHSVTTK